jgi:hypothetical protein
LKENLPFCFLLRAKKVFAVVFDYFGAFEKPLAKQLYKLSLHKIRQEEGACLVRPDSS